MDINSNAATSTPQANGPAPQAQTPVQGGQPAAPSSNQQQDPVQSAGDKAGAQVPDSNTDPKDMFGSLSDEDRKYLKAQGVEQLNAESISKFINSHKSLRGNRSEQSSNGSIQDAFVQAAQGNVSQEQTPAQPQQPEPQGQPASSNEVKSNSSVSELELYNFATSLSTQFPKLQESFSDQSFFKGMQDLGIPLVKPDGSVNINGVTAHARYQSQIAEMQEKLNQANKPDANSVPEAKPNVASDQPTVQQMDERAALNIIKWSNEQSRYGKPVHPQLNDARAWMKQNVSL